MTPRRLLLLWLKSKVILRWRRNENGSSIVEAAFVSIFLLLLLAGVADFGRAFYTYIAITNAAEEGARYAARVPYNISGIRQAVKDESRHSGIVISNDQISISPNLARGVPQPGTAVRVEVDYDIPTILGGILGLDTIHLHSSASMPILGYR